MLKQVVHLTSVHPRYDTRIFLKECRSLVKAGYSVSLVVADGIGDEVKDGVNIVDVGVSSGRFDRMLNVTRRVFGKAKQLDADIYHIHDPELIPYGLKLKKLSKKVIFDSHEDVPKQILYKPYLNKISRKLISQAISLYESWACRKFDAVVAATPFIRDKFLSINQVSVDINNFPILGELANDQIDWSKKKKQICYVGAISKDRGIEEMVIAMSFQKSKVRLQLGGFISKKNVGDVIKALPGWDHVDALGFLDRASIRDVFKNSITGLVVLHPIKNYIDALPVKMFEYMVSGLPVIASNFPLWREIVEGNDCGICVDPLDPQEIAEAVDHLENNPERAEQMGRNGQRAVQKLYNWSIEEQKLFNLYQDLI